MALLISGQGNDDLYAKLGEHAMRLASEVIEDCRVQLMLKFRFLDLALWQMPLEPIWGEARYPLATDAVNMYCEPFGELSRYMEAPDEAVRDLLHLVMHCIYSHPFDRSHPKTELWWLACDVMAETSCMDICGSRFESPGDGERREVMQHLATELGNVTPGRLYKLFEEAWEGPVGCGAIVLDRNKLIELQSLFERDAHGPWPGNPERDAEMEKGRPDEIGDPDPDSQEKGEHANQEAILDPEGEGDMQQASDEGERGDKEPEDGGTDAADKQSEPGDQDTDTESGSDDIDGDESTPGEGSEATDKARKRWRDISKRMETDLETFSKEWGDTAGGLVNTLKIANRETVDYSEFLRRFSIITEDIKINPDEYDLVFYTYGLSLYGDMPLVEPLEYMETKRIRDFVIAIDTSGSVRGELVKKFVEHTFTILKESEVFGGIVNIHIVQCDTEIQADAQITSLEDLDGYLEEFEVKGFGGTDFRPVFDYVDKLIDKGELEDMRGIIYFTDGLGQYPTAAPPYDVAFVFINDEKAEIPAVPPWAMRVLVDEDGITGYE